MMGKRIDRWVLAALGTAGGYLFFLNAWGSIPLACLAAFAACLLARRALGLLPDRQRGSLARAREALPWLAGMDEAAAAARLEPLIRARWPGEAFRLAPVLKHPEASLSSGDVLNAWKANRDAARLVIAATCPCEPRARLFAGELRAPAVAVLDSRALMKLLRHSDVRPPEAPMPPLGTRLRRGLARVAAARVSPKDGLIALALLALYLLRGHPASLFASLALLAHIGVALIQRRMGRKLFEP